MKVTPAGYAHFINALSCLSNGKLCVLLEVTTQLVKLKLLSSVLQVWYLLKGGYCIKSLSEGVALTLRALLGYPTPRIEDLLKPDPM